MSGDIEPTQGQVIVGPGMRISTLTQDHFAFNDVKARQAVIMSHTALYAVIASGAR